MVGQDSELYKSNLRGKNFSVGVTVKFIVGMWTKLQIESKLFKLWHQLPAESGGVFKLTYR